MVYATKRKRMLDKHTSNVRAPALKPKVQGSKKFLSQADSMCSTWHLLPVKPQAYSQLQTHMSFVFSVAGTFCVTTCL